MYPNLTMSELANKLTPMRYSKRSGRHFGRCPFCKETVGTFFTDDKKGYYYCYSCGAAGDRKDLLTAVTHTKPKLFKNEKDVTLTSIYADAAFFYYEMLAKEKNAGAAYLFGRGITAESITVHGLGFAPDSFCMLYDHLKGRYTKEDLLRSGLFKISKNGNVMDLFRNRVMFPIMDASDDVVAFGGRIMADADPKHDPRQPKYINSPETEIFNKRKLLYGFPYQQPVHGKALLLCEGYMDYIAMYDARITDCAATLGTALTKDQIALIKTFYDNVCLMPDTDGPGVRAAVQSANELTAAGVNVFVADLKPAKDPDEFLRRFGRAPFEIRLKGAVPAHVFIARNSKNAADIVDALMQQVS